MCKVRKPSDEEIRSKEVALKECNKLIADELALATSDNTLIF